MSLTPEQKEKIEQIVKDVFEEIESAHAKHGPLPDDFSDCMLVIGEEFGEACKAAWEFKWMLTDSLLSNIRKELIQVAAMSIATIYYGGL